MRGKAFWLGLALCLAASGAAAAEPDPELTRRFEAGVAQARQGMAAGEAAKTLGGLREALAAAWRAIPFSVLDARLIVAQPQGYAQPVAREGNVFAPGDPMIVYLEPVGFSVRRDPETGAYLYDLAADFNLVGPAGKVVGGRRDFARFQGDGRHFPDHLPITITYSLAGLPPGEYKVETVLKDRLGGGSATVVTPILINGR